MNVKAWGKENGASFDAPLYGIAVVKGYFSIAGGGVGAAGAGAAEPPVWFAA
jgi:hypothetical protein